MGTATKTASSGSKLHSFLVEANKALAARDYAKVDAFSESALALDADCGEAYLMQSRAAMARGYHHQAISVAGKAQTLLNAPDEATLTVAMGLSKLGEYAKAKGLFDGIVQRHPGWVDARLQRADNAVKQVDMEAARFDFLVATASSEKSGAGWYGYAYTKAFADGDDDLQRLISDAQNRDGRNGQAGEDDFLAKFALGKANGDIGRFPESLEAYTEGNRLQSIFNRSTGGAYESPAVLADVRKILVEYSDALDAMESGSAGEPEGIVTLCGLPRVGKTLLQGYIERHRDVKSLSERNVLSTLTARVGIKNTGLLVESLARLKWSQIAALSQVLPKCWEHGDGQYRWGVTTDPTGDRCVGAMALLSSGARTVWCRRDPEANALAIFCRYFTSVRFSTSFEDIAMAQVVHHGLMSFWASKLPERVHVVDYEQFVRSPDATLASVLEFLGLDAKGLDDGAGLAEVGPDLLSSAGSVQVATRANPDFDTLKHDYAIALPQIREAFSQAVELVGKRVPEIRPYLPEVPSASGGAAQQAV